MSEDIQRDPSGFPDPGRPRFCARCGAKMQETTRDGRARPRCPVCGWTYYAKNALGAAVLVERDGQILLVRRAHDPYQGWWMLPAGFVEYGEDAAETAKREALEECALHVEVLASFGLYFGSDDPRNPSYLIVYRAAPQPPDAEPAPGDDAAEVGWFGAGALPSQIAFEGHRHALRDWRAGQR